MRRVRYLVTGASGFIGYELTRSLVEAHGADAVVAAIGPHPSATELRRGDALRRLGVRLVAIDLTRADVFDQPPPAFDVLFHLAAYANPERKSDGVRIRRYLLVAMCLILGLLAKPMLVTLPVVLLLLDLWPLRRWPGSAPLREGGRLILEKVPLLVLAAAASAVTLFTQESFGAVPQLNAVPLALRTDNALVAYVRYIGKLVWPAKLAIFYPLRPLPTTAALAAAAFLIAVTLLALRLYRRWPQVTVGWLWYLITLLPVIGFLQVGGQSMADRYTYIPSIGLLLIVVWSIADVLPSRRAARAAAAVAAAATLSVLAVLTRLQLGYWQNSETIFAHALAVTKDNFMAHNNLGVALAARGRGPKRRRITPRRCASTRRGPRVSTIWATPTPGAAITHGRASTTSAL